MTKSRSLFAGGRGEYQFSHPGSRCQEGVRTARDLLGEISVKDKKRMGVKVGPESLETTMQFHCPVEREAEGRIG